MNVPRAALSTGWWPVFAAGALAVATIGFLTGTRGRDLDAPRPVAHEGEPEPGVPLAPTYAEIRADRRSDNRLRHPGNLAAMAADRPAPPADRPKPTDAEKAEALAARAARRAYDGAPPTIPHPIRQDRTEECLACHAEGLRVESRTGPAVPHDRFTSCTQCHVVSERALPSAPIADVGPPFADNAFTGLAGPGGGDRASPGAPPVIPHGTRMRETCGSCHGALATGLSTSHPWRASCTQCHAPSAALDLRPLSNLPPLAGMP